MQKAELAWQSGDAPDAPEFNAPVHPLLAAAIAEALPSLGSNASVTALRKGSDASGRYRLKTDKGNWFVRISARAGYPDLENAIVEFLNREGVPVAVPAVPSAGFDWQGKTYRLDAREMIESRHFDGSAADIARTKETVSACHDALRRFPYSERVRDLSLNRFTRIEKMRLQLLEIPDLEFLGAASQWANAHRDWIEGVLERFSADFAGRPGAQVLHGEIHPGNVLFRKSDNAAVLIDFEEAPVTFAPPDWDHAYLAQRFGMTEKPSEALTAMMRDIAGCLLCIAARLAFEEGVETPITEFEKFHRLDLEALEMGAT